MKTYHLYLPLLLSVCNISQADWLLDEKNSQLNFLTTKNTHISENNTFTRLTGDLSEKGTAKLHIDLNSLDTHIPLRDERIRKLLLNTDQYPHASIQVQLNPQELASLLVAQSRQLNLVGQLNLHGKTVSLPARVETFKDENGAIHIFTLEPVLLDLVALGLDNGVEQLRALAKASNISYTVPVTFHLIYTPLPM